MSKRRILLVLVSLFAAVAMSAQNYNVTVKLEDATNGEPVGFATVSLTPEKGNAKYALTDHDGKGTIEKVKAGKYTFKAEIMGYPGRRLGVCDGQPDYHQEGHGRI